MVSVLASLGFPEQQERRRAEFEEASRRARFVPVILDPPLDISLPDDLARATERRGAASCRESATSYGATRRRVPVAARRAPRARDRGARACSAPWTTLPSSIRWWMWGIWGDLPAPNVFYPFGEPELDRMLHILEAYEGELERNDYRRLLSGRATTNAVLGSERVFGFGSPAASPLPYAEVLTEVRRIGRPLDGLRSPPARRRAAARSAVRPRPHRVGRVPERAPARRPHPRGPRRGRRS